MFDPSNSVDNKNWIEIKTVSRTITNIDCHVYIARISTCRHLNKHINIMKWVCFD